MERKYKHTPGPWRTGEPFAIFEGSDLRFHISQADGAQYTPNYSDVAQFVAETIPGEKLEIQKANASLIAAAPCLLEALEACRSHMYEHASNTDDGAFDKLCATIARATGETR